MSAIEITLPLVQGSDSGCKLLDTDGKKRMLTAQDPDLNIAKSLACNLYRTIFEKLTERDKEAIRKLNLAFLYLHQNKQEINPEFTEEFKKTEKIPSLMTECPIWPKTLEIPNNLRVISAWTQSKTNEMIGKTEMDTQFLKDTTPEKKALDNLQNMKVEEQCPAFVIFGKTSPCYELGSDSCADKFVKKREDFYQSCPDTKFFLYIDNPPVWEMSKQKLSDDDIKTIFAKKTTV